MEDLTNSLLYIPKYFKVLTKPGPGGYADLVLMNLWPVQKYYIEHRTHRDIILKDRQTGMSTGILADNSHALFTADYERQAVIAHDDETASFLLQTVHRFRDNLPADMRPKVDWKSGSRIRFPDLDGYIYIDSAKSESIGIGRSLTRAHLSEVAKWPSSKESQLFADISQTVGEQGYISVESTPRGRGGLFHTLYDSAKRKKLNYTVFFFPWWWDITCVSEVMLGTKLSEQIERASYALGKSTGKYLEEEEDLRGKYNLSPEQISFRRNKIQEIKELFFQEYPENDLDCWMVAELCPVDASVVRRYHNMVQEGRQEGNLTIWKDVRGGHRYKIGVDVAAGLAKGDFSVASVIDVQSCEYVARLRGRIPSDLFAEQLFTLGKRYNLAQIGVEKAGHGHTVLRIMLEKGYPELFVHQDYDDMTKSMVLDYGWKTTIKTKPQMIDTLQSALRSGDLISYSENLLDEIGGLLYDPNKKVIKTTSNSHDDEWDALSIALMMREISPIMEYEQRPKATQYAGV